MENQLNKDYKMLKNYVVKIENVEKGKENKIIKYMFNETHQNHTKTTILKNGVEDDGDEFFLHLQELKHKNEMNYLKNKKGGKKLKRIAKSLTFNIPKYYEVSEAQAEEINALLEQEIFKLFEAKGIEIDKILSVIHYQDNTHIHTQIPTLDKHGKNIRELNTKSFLTELKIRFTQSVDAILKTNIEKAQTCTKEETEHNLVLVSLNRLKADYERLMTTVEAESKAYKYLNNEITTIDRTLKNYDEKTIATYKAKINKKLNTVNTHFKTKIKGI